MLSHVVFQFAETVREREGGGGREGGADKRAWKLRKQLHNSLKLKSYIWKLEWKYTNIKKYMITL